MAKKDLILVVSVDDKGTPQIKRIVRSTKGELRALERGARETGRGFDKLKRDVAGTGKGLGKLKGFMKSTMVQMAAGMGVMMGVQGAMRLVTGAITNFIKVGREFEREWANVTTMLSISQAETEKLKWHLIELSPVLGSTTDLARGMYQVLSASIEPAKAIAFLGEAAKSAVAGVTETKTAVDALTTVINAYGMAAEQVTEVSDIMFQTVKRGKLTYEGMAGALGTVVPIAAQVGVRFEELAAAMATLTRQGVDVNTTTVQLRQIMVSVLKPTSEAETAAKRLGLAFTSQALAAKGLVQFLADVREKVGDDMEAMTALFGNVRALTGIMGLAGKSAVEFASDLELMENAAGSTEEAFKKQMQTLDFWIKAGKNLKDSMQIAFYEGLVTPMRKVINTQEDLDEAFKSMTETARSAGETLGLIGKFFKLLQPMINQYLQSTINFKVGIARLVQFVTLGYVPALDNLKQKQWEIIVTEARMAKGEKKLGENMKGIWGVLVRGQQAWKAQLDLYINSGMAAEEYLPKLEALWKGTSKWQLELKGLAAIEALDIKRKGQLDDKLTILVKNIEAAWGSNKVFASSLKTAAKEAVELARITGAKLSPTIRKLAGLIQSVYAPAQVQASKALQNFKITLKDIPAEVDEMKDSSDVLATVLGGGLEDILTGQKEVENEFGLMNSAQLSFRESTLTTNQKIERGIIKTGTAVDTVGLKFGILAGIIQGMGASIGGTFGQLAGAAAMALGAISTSIKNIGDESDITAGAVLEGIGPEVWVGIGTAIGTMAAGSTPSFAGMGASIGGLIALIPGIGAAFAVILPIIGGLFGSLFKKKTEAEKKMEELEASINRVKARFSELGRMSDQTAKSFLELSKKMGSTNAEMEMMPELMNDIGVTMRNVEAWGKRLNAMLDISGGQWGNMDEIIRMAGDAFNTYIDHIIRLGLEGSPAVVQFIQKVREMGMQIAEVDEYVYDWLDQTVEGLYKMAEGSSNTSDEISRLGNLAVATFGALTSQGKSYIEALDEMGEVLVLLSEKYVGTGTAANTALQELLKVAGVRDTHRELFEAIDANNTVLQALGNTGFLTQNIMKDTIGQTILYYEQLQSVGLSSNQALRAIAPTLQDLEKYAENYGLGIDDATQGLIDQARAMEYIKDPWDEWFDRWDAWFDRWDRDIALPEDRERVPMQMGYHGEVVGPADFHIEPGHRERVDIEPVSSYKDTGHGAEGGSGGTTIIERPITIRPLFIPREDLGGIMIEFLEEASEDERIKFSTRALRR